MVVKNQIFNTLKSFLPALSCDIAFGERTFCAHSRSSPDPTVRTYKDKIADRKKRRKKREKGEKKVKIIFYYNCLEIENAIKKV